jgi:hypothetical protein
LVAFGFATACPASGATFCGEPEHETMTMPKTSAERVNRIMGIPLRDQGAQQTSPVPHAALTVHGHPVVPHWCD